jgi:hypothetical protein
MLLLESLPESNRGERKTAVQLNEWIDGGYILARRGKERGSQSPVAVWLFPGCRLAIGRKFRIFRSSQSSPSCGCTSVYR